MSATNIDRALGRIEGTQSQILSELIDLKKDYVEHLKNNALEFRRIDTEFAEAARALNQHLNEQYKKLDAMKEVQDRARGAGWIILSLIGGLATFSGGAVIAALSGWLRFHT